MATLASMPTEVLVKVLEAMDLRDLLACKQVSSFLNSVIAESATLQYKIELAAAGMEDSLTSNKSTIEKRSLLHQYQKAWGLLTSTTPGTVPLEWGHSWHLASGVLSYMSNPGQRINFHQFISPLKGIPERRWSIEVNLVAVGLVTDPSQDLLVLLYFSERKLCARSLSMSTGQEHPLARCADIVAILPQATSLVEERIEQDENPQLELGIYKESLVVQIEYFRDTTNGLEYLFTMCNWQTGEVILALPPCQISDTLHPAVASSPYSTFAVLSNTHLLLGSIVSTGDLTGTAAVVDIIDYTLGEAAFSHAVTLQLPAINADWEFTDIGVSRRPCRPTLSNQVPFVASELDTIILIELVIEPRGFENFEDAVLLIFVRTEEILSCLERAGTEPTRTIPWNDWGPTDTRAQLTWGEFKCCMFGSRAARTIDNHLVIEDFNPFATRSGAPFSTESISDGTENVLDVIESTTIRSQLFMHPIKTSLPYRVTRTSILAPFDGMIEFSEDTILIFPVVEQPSENLTISI